MPDTLLTGIALGESPRWHDGRLWFADWGAQEIVAVDVAGNRERSSSGVADVAVLHRLAARRAAAGRVGERPALLRQEPDGSLVTHADLSGLSASLERDRRRRPGQRLRQRQRLRYGRRRGPHRASSPWSRRTARVRQVADGIAFPNGMAVTPDNSTLIVAESYGKRLTAFDIAADGGLSNRRVWAELGDGVPDGICLDAEGAVWYADVPNQRCVRVREGGEVLQTRRGRRGCFACMLGGGAERRTLFIMAAEWPAAMDPTGPRTGQVLTVPAPAAGVGWP